ncbi:ABC transporter substrate-binding protein [Leeia oryzae]|uniref:ABC transporter substrate-binding protein n=1 Tax=Leeia oryzae TaxID=356662 RepID=UPI000375BBDB|nr:ABC transporter substrate-binding protein [Leeia oryzae]
MKVKQVHGKKKALVVGLLSAACLAKTAHAEDRIEVMHFWTSGGEAAALNILKDDLKKRGYGWLDSPVAGGGGEQAKTTLRARIASGNPPEAALTLGFDTIDYATENFLGNLDALAEKENWGTLIPSALQKFSKINGHWVAAPLLVHRSNWVWANKAIFTKLNLAPPKNFSELLAVSQKIRQAGYIPLAHGGQAWQEAALFDSAVLSAGGPGFYKQALIYLDPKALGSKTMEKAFEQLKALRGMTDPNFPGRDWNQATSMVINGKAAMQVMGDWAKGEFTKAGKVANKDYLCFAYPGTEGSFVFLGNQFSMFKTSGDGKKRQLALASAIMNKDLQEKFSMLKGSIPARLDASDANFDDCGKKSMADMRKAALTNNLLGSYAFGFAVNESMKGAITDIVSKAFNDPTFTPAMATQKLVEVVNDNKS